jgi:poly(A) polymerase
VSGAAQLADAVWLKEGEVARLLSVLDRDGEEARVVGGAVRNALLRVPIGEIDVATTALPEEVTRRVEAAGGKAVPTGVEHGTVTAIIGHRQIEVTTLRQDVETFGRKARVVFGRDWRADAERRDFTINALSATAAGALYDYVGGLDDIAARRVRFIGEPRQRIEEDYLRILRFFRFHANFGESAPDNAALHACIAARAGLETLSRERVHAELLKLLLAPRATATLAIMAECGLLGMILGGVAFLASFENLVKAEASLGAEPDAVRRLGALGVRVKEDADRLTSRLRLSVAEAERLLALELGGGWCRTLTRSRRMRFFINSGRNRFSTVCWSPGRDQMRALPTTIGDNWRACRSVGPRLIFLSKRLISCNAAFKPARSLATRCARPRKPGSRRIFPPTARF